MTYIFPAALQLGNFFRPLPWRWQRANYLIDPEARRRPGYDDAETIEIAQYLRCVRRRRKARAPARQMASRWAGLAEAQRVFDGPSRRRHELEACILCEMTDDAIAKRFKLSAGGVRWYEAAFFRVRDRLKASDWIVHTALSRNPHTANSDKNDDGRIIKMFAYYGGPPVLEVVLAVVDNRPLPIDPAAPSGGDRAYCEAKTRLICSLLIETLKDPSCEKLQSLLRIYDEAARIDGKQIVSAPTFRADLHFARATFDLVARRRRPQKPDPRRKAEIAATDNEANIRKISAAMMDLIIR